MFEKVKIALQSILDRVESCFRLRRLKRKNGFLCHRNRREKELVNNFFFPFFHFCPIMKNINVPFTIFKRRVP
jgi:hypothetical protein